MPGGPVLEDFVAAGRLGEGYTLRRPPGSPGLIGPGLGYNPRPGLGGIRALPYDPSNPFINLTQFGGPHYAENLHAALLQQQYADYRRRYLPIAESLLRDVGENFNQNLQNELGLTTQTIANVAGAEEGSAERRMARYGIKKDYDLGNTMTSSLVGGLNATRLSALDRRDAIQAGGAGLRAAMSQNSGGG